MARSYESSHEQSALGSQAARTALDSHAGSTTLTGRLRRRSNGAAVGDIAAAANAPTSGGIALPEGLRTQFESSLGSSLGSSLDDVRIHTSNDAAAAAGGVGARAYALGSNIYFNAGEYQPDSAAGKHLIAHEVAHTVQQKSGGESAPQFKLEVGGVHDSAESDADRAADAMVAGLPTKVIGDGSGAIRRSPPREVTEQDPRFFAPIIASVVNINGEQGDEFMTVYLNQGAQHGVTRARYAVFENGHVGRVVSVYPTRCKVQVRADAPMWRLMARGNHAATLMPATMKSGLPPVLPGHGAQPAGGDAANPAAAPAAQAQPAAAQAQPAAAQAQPAAAQAQPAAAPAATAQPAAAPAAQAPAAQEAAPVQATAQEVESDPGEEAPEVDTKHARFEELENQWAATVRDRGAELHTDWSRRVGISEQLLTWVQGRRESEHASSEAGAVTEMLQEARRAAGQGRGADGASTVVRNLERVMQKLDVLNGNSM